MGVRRLYMVGSPYNVSELADVDYEQTADVMYLGHLDHPVEKLSRLGHTDWSFGSVTFGPGIDPPTGIAAEAVHPNDGSAGGDDPNFWPITQSYVVTAVNDDTAQQSRASETSVCSNDLTLPGNYNTITWDTVTGADRYYIYKSEEGSGSFGYVGSATSTTFADNNIGADMTDTPPLGRNPFPGEGDYPSTVAFFEQRLILGRTRNRPNGVWGSQSANFENMDVSRPLKADDALSFALVARKANSVNQLVSTTALLALTDGNVFAIGGGEEPLTPTNIRPRSQIGRGSARLKPIVVDNVVFYRPSIGSSVRAIGFSFEMDGYRSDNVSIYSPHLFEGHSILWWAHGQEPLSVIWAGRSDGKLLCFTWEQEQQVWGWTLCETDGFPVSGCVITEDGEDRLYMVVRRTVLGVSRWFIERMAAVLWNDQAESCYLDCARSFGFTTPTTVIDKLWHLEGRTVSALADGVVYEDLVVSNGTVVLPNASSMVTVGLPYVSLVETLPHASVATGRRQAPKKVEARILNTRGIEVGASDETLKPVKDRTTESYGSPTDLQSGIVSVNLMPVWKPESTVVLRQTLPLPFTLLGVYFEVDVHS